MQSLSFKVFVDFNGGGTARLPCFPSRLGSVGADFEAGDRRLGLNYRDHGRTCRIVACSSGADSQSQSASSSSNSFLTRSQSYALLKQQMEVAAKSEDYEEAARLRDSLKSFEEEEPVLHLKRLLREAIANEKFEDAARYRDELKEIAPHCLLKCSSDATTLVLLFELSTHGILWTSGSKIFSQAHPHGHFVRRNEAGGDHPSIGFQFEIHVEEIHMSPECYVVYISPLFKKLCSMWDTIQSIYVYSGNGSWKLDICRRDDYYRSTIEDGWQQLRDGLALEVGDICIFECPVDSLDRFNVRVVKKQ
nr:PREDICTED: uncharacterized protein LOC108196528 isoform X2 [Daucus carota subsp. sativus]